MYIYITPWQDMGKPADAAEKGKSKYYHIPLLEIMRWQG